MDFSDAPTPPAHPEGRRAAAGIWVVLMALYALVLARPVGVDDAKIEAALRKSVRPLFAVLFPFEYNENHLPEISMPGRWTEVGEVEYVRILRRDPPSPKS